MANKALLFITALIFMNILIAIFFIMSLDMQYVYVPQLQAFNPNVTESAENEKLSILTDTERVKYYMGKWYNESFHKNKSSRYWQRSNVSIKWSIFNKSSYDYNIREHYWNEFFGFLNLSKEESFECEQDFRKQALFRPNDALSTIDYIPVFVKARYVDRNYPIPLQIFRYERHWRVPLDLHQTDKYEDPEWSDKSNKAVWRGLQAGSRYKRGERLSFVQQYFDSVSPNIDIGFIEHDFCKYYAFDVVNCTVFEALSKDTMTYNELLKHKYLISIEGNDIATNLKWILYSNSCPIMPVPTRESWAMEGLLKPYVHFVPIHQNETTGKWNLEQQIEYCIKNDNVCQEIAQNGKKYILQNNFLDLEHERRVQQKILDLYCQQYTIMR